MVKKTPLNQTITKNPYSLCNYKSQNRKIIVFWLL